MCRSFFALLALSFLLISSAAQGQNPFTTVAGGGLPTPGAAYEAAEYSSSTMPFGETERENQVDFCLATNLGIPGESKNES
jgi:hypothetical protein